jgi:uncharacterized membrane protein YdjX (TVP38/TMEM64 family)
MPRRDTLQRFRGLGWRVALLLALPLVPWLLRESLGLSWTLEGLRAAVENVGVWGPVFYVLVMAFRSVLLLPSQVVLLAGGLCFGGLAGGLYGGLGLWLSGVWLFGLTRGVAREEVGRRVPAGIRRGLEVAGTRGAAGILTLATAYPVGFLTGYHAAAGLTPMSFGLFALALGAGAWPRAWIWAAFGSALSEGGRPLWLAGGALTLALLLPLLHPGARAFLRRQFAAEGGPPAEGEPQHGPPRDR